MKTIAYKSSDEHPLNILNSFFHEMHEWECNYYRKIKTLLDMDADAHLVDLEEERAEKALSVIYATYGIRGKTNAERVESLVVGDPPAYEAKPDIIEGAMEEEKKAVYIVKQTPILNEIYRYTLAKDQTRWNLTKREFLVEDKNRWKAIPF